mgnify:CR=1 FL=1
MEKETDTFTQIEATTVILQNATVAMWHCTNMFVSASRYWQGRLKEYNGNTSIFFLSMLQNLLGRVISMTNLYYSFEQNVLTNNITGINYDAARLTRVLLIFDPLEPIDEELDRI